LDGQLAVFIPRRLPPKCLFQTPNHGRVCDLREHIHDIFAVDFIAVPTEHFAQF